MKTNFRKFARNFFFALIVLVSLSLSACNSGGDWLEGTNDNNNQRAYNYAECLADAGNDFAKASQCK